MRNELVGIWGCPIVAIAIVSATGGKEIVMAHQKMYSTNYFCSLFKDAL
jgi:hypothetical protein